MTARAWKSELAAAVGAMTFERWRALLSGVGARADVLAGGVGVARVRRGPCGGFEFWPEGIEAVVIGAWSAVFEAPGRRAGADALCLRGREAMPDLVDLVAWHPEAPHGWMRRGGLAEWLGEAHARAAMWGDDDGRHPPLRLNASPLSWLANGCAGAVLLEPADGERTLRDILWGVRRIVCDDAAHADAVYRALRRPGPRAPLPKVYRVQKSEDRSQMSEDRDQRAEGRRRGPEDRDTPVLSSDF